MELYIQNMPYETGPNEIAAPFMNFGWVVSAKQIMGNAGPGDIEDRGRPLGYGFVSMPNQREAENALAGLQNKLAFLSNLSQEFTTGDLENAFEEYMPTIVRIVNLGNPDLPPKGQTARKRAIIPSENGIGYIIFNDERVARSFRDQYGRPMGTPPTFLGREICVRLAKIERAKTRKSHNNRG